MIGRLLMLHNASNLAPHPLSVHTNEQNTPRSVLPPPTHTHPHRHRTSISKAACHWCCGQRALPMGSRAAAVSAGSRSTHPPSSWGAKVAYKISWLFTSLIVASQIWRASGTASARTSASITVTPEGMAGNSGSDHFWATAWRCKCGKYGMSSLSWAMRRRSAALCVWITCRPSGALETADWIRPHAR